MWSELEKTLVATDGTRYDSLGRSQDPVIDLTPKTTGCADYQECGKPRRAHNTPSRHDQ
jgi:hypothetical protein